MASQSNQSKAAARAAKAAELRAAQQKAESRRRLLTIGGVLAVVVLIIGAAVLYAVLQEKDRAEDLESAATRGSEFSVALGDEDAPREVVIYEDFLCPFCGELERQTSEDLARLAADGKVYVEYRPFDLLSNSFGDYPIRATNAFAVVLEEEGPEVALAFHDLLFEEQPEEGGPYPSDDDLVDLAVQAGADEDTVRPGIEDLAQQDWVESATQEAVDAGVSGTPTVLLDGQQYTDGSSIDEIAANLIKELE